MEKMKKEVIKIADKKMTEYLAQVEINNLIDSDFDDESVISSVEGKCIRLLGELGMLYDLGFIDWYDFQEIKDVLLERRNKRVKRLKEIKKGE